VRPRTDRRGFARGASRNSGREGGIGPWM